jgi:protoporphyrinogen oxidase
LADEVAIPLTEAWSGIPAEELSPAVGEKFATSLPRTLMLKAAGKLTRRTVAVGYSGTVAESPHVWHVYPEGGIGAVCEALASEVGDAVQTQSPAEEIEIENETAVAVRAGGRRFAAAAVISTVPVPLLAKLGKGSSALAHLAKFRYRPMTFVNLRFRGPSGLPDVVTWFPERHVPFFRTSDIAQGLPWLVPDGYSQVTADIGCQVGDETWIAADEDLGRRCVEALERIIPGIRNRYCGCRVMRTPIAYPVYSLEYEPERKRFETSTGVHRLISVGRNGEFSHSLMEDVYWRTRRRVTGLLEAL